MRVTRWGLYSNILLTAAKFAGGILGNSAALVADGFHSVSDMLSDGVTMLTIRHASQPADQSHPYGHGKIEDLGSGVISGILVATGLGISWHSLDSIHHLYTAHLLINPMMETIVTPSSSGIIELFKNALSLEHEHGHNDLLATSTVALCIAIGCIAVKEALFHLTMRVAKETKSQIVEVNAWHHRSDSLSSLVAVVGIGGTLVGIPIIDPIAAIIVGAMITKQGYDMGKEALLNITDHAIDTNYKAQVEQRLHECNVFGVAGYHALRGRRMGRYYVVDVDLFVPPYLSVSAAHQISEQVRLYLLKHVDDLSQCTVHVDILEDHPSSESSAHDHVTKIPPYIIRSQKDIDNADEQVRVLEQFLELLRHEDLKQAEILLASDVADLLPSETLRSVGRSHAQLMRSVLVVQNEVEQTVLTLQAKQNIALCVGRKNIIPHFVNNRLQVDVEVHYGCECGDSLLNSPETLSKTFFFADTLKSEIEKKMPGVTARVLLNLTK